MAVIRFLCKNSDDTKNSEIDEEYQRFEKGEDRDKKLEALKQEMESAEKYKKTEGAYKECSVHYEKIIAQMKNSFVSEYDDTISLFFVSIACKRSSS